MTRYRLLPLIAVVLLAATPRAAHADLTVFFGATPKPAARSAQGFAIGVSLVVIGFEFEYARTAEQSASGAPALGTGMLNGMVMTPTKTQLYLTAGGGLFRETLSAASTTSFGTNIGGGIKFPLLGPIRLRVDYRVFNLRGSPLYPTPQRIYVGANLAF
jgi:hypothetical protein